jgi:membrane-associated protein
MPSPVETLVMGVDWLDPAWLLDEFGSAFFWVSLLIIVVECGLFFPFLPGDTLLVAIGLFLAGGQLSVFPGPALLDLALCCLALVAAAILGNVIGYEIGRQLGPALYRRDGRLLKRDHLDRSERFFDEHGRAALVVGRFVPIVRTYVTVVAGASRLDRARFVTWSLLGALIWVLSITLLGYFLGDTFPALVSNVDYLVLGLLLLMVIPAGIHWWRERRSAEPV